MVPLFNHENESLKSRKRELKLLDELDVTEIDRAVLEIGNTKNTVHDQRSKEA